MDLLRFATAGSVDDGKSTMIGRLLYDTKTIFEDQMESVEKTSKDKGFDYTDLALLTDGLRSEREQGITIDVAYRYFATPKRKFIIADTPGHVQYTRNMVTGASTADLAIVLVDARKGMLEQSRRHAFLASLLRVPHLVVAVNKMDLVDWSEEVYEGIREEFAAFATKLEVPDLTVAPISAPRPPTWRSCWSTPARDCWSRAAGTPSSPRCCGCRTWSSRSTRWTWSTGRRKPSRRSATSSAPSPRSCRSPT